MYKIFFLMTNKHATKFPDNKEATTENVGR